MKLSDKDYKRFLELKGKVDAKTASDDEVKEFKYLSSVRGSKSPKKDGFVPGNDFSWWNKYPELMRDAANMKSNFIPGTDILRDNGAHVGVVGVIEVQMLDTFGAESSASHPLNVMARDVFLKMFQKYRGITQYQAADVGITIIACSEVFKMVWVLERIYGIINRYSKKNWNLPYTELAALGVNTTMADYIRAHLSDFRYDLNVLISKAQRLCMPKDFSFVLNKMSLYGYEYMDHNSEKGQIILFRPTHFGVFSETTLSTGGCIINTPAKMDGSNGITSLISIADPTSTMFPMLNNMIEQLVSSDSIQKIFGDFLAWFGEGQMLVLQPLPEDFVIAPVYSESILHKLHNLEAPVMYNSAMKAQALKPCSAISTNLSQEDVDVLFTMQEQLGSGNTWTIYQESNVIVTKFGIYSGVIAEDLSPAIDGFKYARASTAFPSCNYSSPTKVLDSYHSDYSDEIVSEGLLWKPCFITVSNSNERGQLTGCNLVADTVAFEVPLYINIWERTSDGTISGVTAHSYISKDDPEELLRQCRLGVCDWAPIFYVAEVASWFSVPATDKFIAIGSDIDCCRAVNADDIRRVHNACLLSGLKTEVTPTK